MICLKFSETKRHGTSLSKVIHPKQNKNLIWIFSRCISVEYICILSKDSEQKLNHNEGRAVKGITICPCQHKNQPKLPKHVYQYV